MSECEPCEEMELNESRDEVYHHPFPWVKFYPPILGFQYNIVGQPEKERFYGVGNRRWWYQWNSVAEE